VANDGQADSNVATVTITVNAINDAPVAVDDAYTTDEDTTLNVPAPGVLSNDSDVDDDLLTAALDGGPTNGTLTLNSDGSFTYVPDPGFIGADSFTYRANDGTADSNVATVSLTVNAVGGAPIIEAVRVEASSDDAEEEESGAMDLNSSDLELVLEASNQTVGMRFNGIDIPQGATVSKAYIQFQTDETNSEATSLSLQGEATDNALTFVDTDGNITSRGRTTAAVSWTPVPWTTRGEAGPNQQTPDIAAVIQEIVNRPGWSSGNSLVIIITGSGKRVAESYNGDQAGAPLLHLEYVSGS
jgi:VCBS repeat-containing protein